MKKLLVFVFVLSSVGATYAQVQVALGLKAGANISKFDADGADNLTSFHAGAFGLFKFTKIGIQPELLFTQQGTTFEDLSGDDVDIKTAYMSIPVMVKLYLIGGLNLQAGPQFGFLTKAEYDGADAKQSFKDSDLSANVGLGWDLPFGLTVDARYNIGLSDVGDDPELPELKSRVIQISIGYKIFKLGK